MIAAIASVGHKQIFERFTALQAHYADDPLRQLVSGAWAYVQFGAHAGLDFFAQMNTAGNLVPLIANNGLVATGETAVRITWDYNALAAVDSFEGNPKAEVVVPATGRFAGVYVQAISAYEPHPNAAKLWMEFLYSDEGQIIWMKGYCHLIREGDMPERGVIPADLLAKLPDVTGAVFPSLAQLNAAKDLIVANWDSAVGADVQAAP